MIITRADCIHPASFTPKRLTARNTTQSTTATSCILKLKNTAAKMETANNSMALFRQSDSQVIIPYTVPTEGPMLRETKK